MNKAELIALVAEKVDLTKKATEQVIDTLFDTISETLETGEKVVISGFGTFETAQVAERTGTIMMGDRKGEKYVTPAHTAPKFKAAKALKDILA